MGKVVILEDICKGCWLCVDTCPKKVLGIGKHLNVKGFHPAVVLNPDGCTACKMCATVCPDIAIEVYK